MQVVIMITLCFVIALLATGTGAIISRCIAWGAKDWLHHRLAAEQARAVRLQAQVQVQTAQAQERARVATAEIQAQAQVVIAREKAQAQTRTAIVEARLKLQSQVHSAQLRAHTGEDRVTQGPTALPQAPPLLTAHAAQAIAGTAPEPLPTIVHWRDIASRVRPGFFVFGIGPQGRLLQKPVTRAYHTLLHGQTRSGKTTAINSLVVQAHVLAQRMDVQLYMTDVKRELGATWGRSSLLAAPVVNEARSAGTLIGELVNGSDGIHSRYRMFEAVGRDQGVICANIEDYERYVPRRPALVFVVIDELNALLELAHKADDVRRNLTVLLQTGAAAGFYVIAGAHYLSAKVLGRDATQQFVSRAHFGTYDPTALRMLFNQATAQPNDEVSPPGRGYIRVQGQPVVLPFQGVYCDEATILAVQRKPVNQPLQSVQVAPHNVADDRCNAEHAVPPKMEIEEMPGAIAAISGAPQHISSPFPCAISIAPISTEVAVDPAKVAQVAALLMENQGNEVPLRKREIIARVWGATTGRRYVAASAEYDTIRAQLQVVGDRETAASSRA